MMYIYIYVYEDPVFIMIINFNLFMQMCAFYELIIVSIYIHLRKILDSK